MARHGERHPPHFPIHDCHDQTAYWTDRLCLAFISNSDILRHPLQCQPALFFGEPPSTLSVREVRKNEDGAEREEDCKRALDVEEPAPGSMSELAVHSVENTGGKEGTEAITDDVSAVENGNAQTELIPLVPLTQEEEGAGEEGCFDETEEKASKERPNEADKSKNSIRKFSVSNSRREVRSGSRKRRGSVLSCHTCNEESQHCISA